MNKKQFLSELEKKLTRLSAQDVAASLDFYAEMIDDRMEDGLTEEEAIASMGPVEEIASQILMETPLPRLVRARLRPNRALRTWEIVLLILGSPIWFPLLLAAGIVLLSVYIVIWSVELVLYAVELSFGAIALSGILGALPLILTAQGMAALLFFAVGLIGIGLTVLFFFVCKYSTIGLAKLTRRIARGIKRKFIEGGRTA